MIHLCGYCKDPSIRIQNTALNYYYFSILALNPARVCGRCAGLCLTNYSSRQFIFYQNVFFLHAPPSLLSITKNFPLSNQLVQIISYWYFSQSTKLCLFLYISFSPLFSFFHHFFKLKIFPLNLYNLASRSGSWRVQHQKDSRLLQMRLK